MKPYELNFDEDYDMYFKSKYLNGKELCLTLSDGLNASNQKHTPEYKIKIVDFINNMHIWHNKAVDAVVKYARDKYGVSSKSDEVELLSIFVLFEQNEDGLFGLEFRPEFDIEHGCGLKMNAIDYEIIEIGLGDVAFC